MLHKLFNALTSTSFLEYDAREELRARREDRNGTTLKKTIKRRILRRATHHVGFIYIAQVTNCENKVRYFKFNDWEIDTAVENIYYYLTDTANSLTEIKFNIEIRRIFEND